MIEHSYVGCDLSKAHVDFFDAVSGRHERIANTPEAIAAHLVGHKGSAVRFVFEATGAYGGALREQLAQAGLAGCQVNPMRARRFAQSLGRLAKTDRIDAATLATMGERLALPPTPPLDPEVETLKELIARRDQLVASRAAEKKRLQQASLEIVRQSLREAIAALSGEIARFERAIAAATSAPRLAQRARLLASLPGIGPATAAVLLAHLPELGSMSPKRIASLAGLAPHPRASGASSRPRFVHGGRARLRRALYMAALGALRANGPLRQTYRRLVERGKPPKPALIALARKIVTIANAMVRDDKAYA